MYRLKKYNRFASQVLTRTDQRKMKEAKAKEKQDKKDNQKDQEPQKGKRTKTSEAEGPGADVEEKPPAKRRRGKQAESAGDGDAKHDPTSQPEPKGKARAKAKAKAKAKAAASKEEGGGETAEAEEAEETKAKAEVVPKRKPRAKAKAKVEEKVEEISKEEEPKAKPKRLRRADTKPYHHSPTKDAPQPEEGMVTPRKTLFQSDDSDDGEQEFKGPALPAEPPSPHMRIADTKTGEVKPLTQIFEEDKPKRHAKSSVEKKSGAASSSFEAADASVGGDAVSSKPKGKGRAGKAKATPKRKNAKNTLSPFAKKEHQKRQRKQKEVMRTSPTEDKVVQDMMIHHAKKCKDMSFEDMKIYLRGTEHKWKHFRLNPYFGRQACGVKTNLVKGDGKSTTEVSYYGKIGTAKNANQGMAVCFTSACLMVSWLMCVCLTWLILKNKNYWASLHTLNRNLSYSMRCQRNKKYIPECINYPIWCSRLCVYHMCSIVELVCCISFCMVPDIVFVTLRLPGSMTFLKKNLLMLSSAGRSQLAWSKPRKPFSSTMAMLLLRNFEVRKHWPRCMIGLPFWLMHFDFVNGQWQLVPGVIPLPISN